jgi:hypothetical protein
MTMSRTSARVLALLIWIAMALSACSPAQRGGLRQIKDEVPRLENLSLQGGVLQGEIVNRSRRTARAVTIEVSFIDSADNELFKQEFQAVPGGDGRALQPGYVKHFNYRLELEQSTDIRAVGRIRTVDYE